MCIRDRIEKAIKELNEASPHVMVMEEREERRPTYVLERGAYDQPRTSDGAIDPGTPEVLNAFSDSESRDRLGLARWLTHRDQPLFARVAVNRFWEAVFGTGIVKTTEDFGTQAEAPSPPSTEPSTAFARGGDPPFFSRESASSLAPFNFQAPRWGGG